MTPDGVTQIPNLDWPHGWSCWFSARGPPHTEAGLGQTLQLIACEYGGRLGQCAGQNRSPKELILQKQPSTNWQTRNWWINAPASLFPHWDNFKTWSTLDPGVPQPSWALVAHSSDLLDIIPPYWLPSLLSFTSSVTSQVFPGITSQGNNLYSNPCLSVTSKGTQSKIGTVLNCSSCARS